MLRAGFITTLPHWLETEARPSLLQVVAPLGVLSNAGRSFLPSRGGGRVKARSHTNNTSPRGFGVPSVAPRAAPVGSVSPLASLGAWFRRLGPARIPNPSEVLRGLLESCRGVWGSSVVAVDNSTAAYFLPTSVCVASLPTPEFPITMVVM
jgi:hypothetical protein